jgi:bifunctional non-homologous end joining protein LigD
MEHITLYYTRGSSDKVYQASIEQADGGHVVRFAYGRRGATLQTGIKTNTPVSFNAAKRVYDKLVAEKSAKGYTPGESGTLYQQTSKEARATGLLPQLLYPVDESAVRKLIADPLWWMQEKFDGRRMLLQAGGRSHGDQPPRPGAGVAGNGGGRDPILRGGLHPRWGSGR